MKVDEGLWRLICVIFHKHWQLRSPLPSGLSFSLFSRDTSIADETLSRAKGIILNFLFQNILFYFSLTLSFWAKRKNLHKPGFFRCFKNAARFFASSRRSLAFAVPPLRSGWQWVKVICSSKLYRFEGLQLVDYDNLLSIFPVSNLGIPIDLLKYNRLQNVHSFQNKIPILILVCSFF